MASLDSFSRVDSEKEAALTTGKAFVFQFDSSKAQWCLVGDKTICKLQLLVRGGYYKLTATSDQSGERVIDLPLNGASSYRPIEDTFYQLTTGCGGFDRPYGFKFTTVQDAKFFAVVLEKTLSSVASSHFQTSSRASSHSSNASSGTGSRSASLTPSQGSLTGQSGSYKQEGTDTSRGYTSLPNNQTASSVDSGHFSAVSSTSHSLSSLTISEDKETLPEAMAHAHRATASLSTSQVEQLVQRFSDAVGSGDRQRAATIAEMLATERVAISVNIEQQSAVKPQPVEETDEISLIVLVEDRDKSGPQVPIKVRPSMTVLELKTKFWRDFHFPVEVQRWIMGDRFMEDHETLESHGITVPNAKVYLYLISAESAGLTQSREEYERTHRDHRQDQNRRNDNAERSNFRVQPVDYLPANIPGPEKKTSNYPSGNFSPDRSSNGAQRRSGTFIWRPPEPEKQAVPPGGRFQELPMDGMPAVKADFEDTNDTHPLGWQCPTCTLINEPTKPGCSACNADRPASYKVPANVQISQEERARLEREQFNERLVLRQMTDPDSPM